MKKKEMAQEENFIESEMIFYDDLAEGDIYEIVEAKKIPTMYGEAIQTLLRDTDKKYFSHLLSIREKISSQSKLGAFVSVFGKDFSSWIGKKFRVVKWEKGNRAIEKINEKE